jgi:hypothetical protein
MRAKEFIPEIFSEPKFYPMPLKMGPYRDAEDPRTGEPYPDQHLDNTELIQIADRLINAGVKPNLMPVNAAQLTATQDWLTDQGGAEDLYPEYRDHPVVLDYKGHFYVLDGHHRASRALKTGQPIQVYLFNSRKLKENFDDGKNPGRKGLAKRVGVNCKQPVGKLRKIAANSSGERQRMAHWCANMKSGKQK